MGNQGCSKCECLNDGSLRQSNLAKNDKQIRPIQFSDEASENANNHKIQSIRQLDFSSKNRIKQQSTVLNAQQNSSIQLKKGLSNLIPLQSKIQDIQIQMKSLGVESRSGDQQVSVISIDPKTYLQKSTAANSQEIKVPFSVIKLIIKPAILKQFQEIQKDFQTVYASPKSHSFNTWRLQKAGFYTNNLDDGTNIILTENMMYKGWTKFQSFVPQNFGILINQKGTYQGNFIEGKAHGKGTFSQIIYQNEEIKFIKFTGKWERGQFKDGKISSDKYQYEGQLQNSLPHGKGQLLIKGQKNKKYKYIGNFSKGKFEGNGKYECDSYVYSGKFKNGKKHGYGILIERQGRSTGKQKNRNGIIIKGQKRQGQWEDDKLIREVKKQ